jgi:hypothetical protein
VATIRQQKKLKARPGSVSETPPVPTVQVVTNGTSEATASWSVLWPSPIQPSRNYHLIRLTSTTGKIADTWADKQAGTAIDLTSGTSVIHQAYTSVEFQTSTNGTTWTTRSGTSHTLINLAGSTTVYARARTFNGTNYSAYGTAEATTDEEQGGEVRPTPTHVVYNDGALTGGGTHNNVTNAIAAGNFGNGNVSILELRNRVAGSTQTWNQVINVNKSGTAARYLKIRVRDGDTVRLSITGGTLLTVTGNYVSIEGNSTGSGGLVLGNPGQWNPQVWGGDYSHNLTMDIRGGAHHVALRNLTAHGCGANYYACEVSNGNCADILIDNCLFSKHGTNQDPDGGGERGDILRMAAKRVVIQDTRFEYGGHNTLFGAGVYQITRRCTFDGDWSDAGTAFPGSRCADFTSGMKGNAQEQWLGEYGPQLIDDCVFENCERSQGDGGGFTYSPAIKLNGLHQIVRGSWFWDNIAPLMLGPGLINLGSAAGDECMGRTICYHNTSYDSGGVYRNQDQSGTNNQNHREGRFVNNVFAQVGNGIGGGGGNVQVVNWDVNLIGLGGYANGWKGTIWRDNLWQTKTTINEQYAAYRVVQPGTPANVTQTLVINPDTNPNQFASWATNVYSNDRVTTITFAGVATQYNRTRAGLTITAGDGYQDAQPLTRANGAGTTDTLVVDDARFFFDGWGFSVDGHTESGDFISINGTIRQIESVNYATNTITLTEAATWADNAPIYYAGNPRDSNSGGVVWDNRGAGQ